MSKKSKTTKAKTAPAPANERPKTLIGIHEAADLIEFARVNKVNPAKAAAAVQEGCTRMTDLPDGSFGKAKKVIVEMSPVENEKADKKTERVEKSKKVLAEAREGNKLSCLDAAHQVLTAVGKPMGCKDLIAKMSEQGLWKSKHGKTPDATLYAAIIREIGTKGKDARFTKADKCLFAAAKA